MKITKFGLSNFRVFKDHFDFDLAPIMVLTGPNNSGKSSLSKALLLLKENKKILNYNAYYGRVLSYFKGEHDLGTHSLVKNLKNENTNFSFTFFEDYIVHYTLNEHGRLIWDYRITTKDNDLVIGQDYLGIDYNIPNLIKYFYARLIYYFTISDTAKKDIKLDVNKIYKVINRLDGIYIRTGNPTLRDTEEWLDAGKLDLLLSSHFSRKTSLKISITNIHWLIPLTIPDFFSLSDLYYINSMKEPLKRAYSSREMSVIQNLLTSVIDKVTIDQGHGFDDINFTVSEELRREAYMEFTHKWIREFDIGTHLAYGFDEENDIYFIKIDGRSLPEFGLGYGLIIHILLALSNEIGRERQKETESLKMQFPPTYIIEEPETGLHPAFQSKMAEMLVDIQKTFNVNLIIETHSEYFIRKLQYLTAKNEVNTGDVVIYYFNNPKKIPEGEEQIKRITILKDGSLSDNFGPGFIDEGLNLKFELLRLNKSQIN